MKFSLIYKLTLVFFFVLVSFNLNAQKKSSEANKRIDDYLELLHQGYSEIEIFQDLGNVNFLTENYEDAIFWYDKLKDNVQIGSLSSSYQERYEYAIEQLNGNVTTKRKDWAAIIKKDYGITPSISEQQNAIPAMASKVKPSKKDEGFTPEMSITRDGKTAYFSQIAYVKPEYGVFSKKQPVHVIYKASNVNGEWKNIQKLGVCPKFYSAKHPTVSADGSRLFFASNMPGTYGKYDIYVSEIKSNGALGIAKNLGPKVNTKKNDLYPNLKNGTLLFFASEGRKGYGGLDLFAVQVAKNTLTESVNLGSSINSSSDDYSLSLVPEKGMGYVMSNRVNKNKLSQIAVTYSKPVNASLVEKSEEGLMRALNNDKDTDYSSTLFEDKKP